MNKKIIKIFCIAALIAYSNAPYGMNVGYGAVTATLSLSPASKNITIGDVFAVDILLNTAGNPVDGVDVYQIHYNPSLLEVIDDISTSAGVQILPGALLPNTIINSVDAAAGKISFSQGVGGGSYTNNTNEALATIHFRAKSFGSAQVTFDFSPLLTTDSNVTSFGEDVLSAVVNGVYTLTEPQDITAPIISNVSFFGVTQTQASVSWTTSEISTSQVDYGLTTAYGSSSQLDVSLSSSHSVILAALSPGTTHHFRVKSKDAAGNESVSTDQLFITQAALAPDTTAPTAIASLASSNITETSVDLTWTASGDDNLDGTAASYDIRYLVSEISETSWTNAVQVSGEPIPQLSGASQSFSLIGLSSATQYTIAMRAIDEAGNVSGLSNVVTITTSQSPGSPPPPQPRVSLVSPGGTQCLEHGQVINVSWTIENADHVALYVTSDGGVVVPVFGQWFFMQNSGESSVITYAWTVPSNITSDTARMWVEAHNAAHTARLAIDAIDSNISIKPSCSSAPAPTQTNPPAPAPASSGGGGGGGGYYAPSDTAAPPQVTDFAAKGADKQITLLWKNPSYTNDWVRTLIVRKASGPPVTPADGTIVYQGTGEEYTDTQIENKVLYYYSAYTLDRIPNYSKPVLVFSTPISGVTSIPTVIIGFVDTDGDTLTDIEEDRLGTDPKKIDTDDDGYTDDIEVKNGYDPINPPSKKKPSPAYLNSVKGKILLQVKRRGEAWYIHTKDLKRYYLRDGEAAYTIMRLLGEGIRTTDLERIPEAGSNKIGDKALIQKMKGKILLQVDRHGEAWYVNAKDGKRHYLKNGQAAYEIMRKLGTGAFNEDIIQIPFGRK